MSSIMIACFVFFANIYALVDFKQALPGLAVNLQPPRAPTHHLSSHLPRTSFLKCQEYPNEGADSFSQFARGPVRTCHMQGVCLRVRESKNRVHLSKYLRKGSQIPQPSPDEFYFGTFSGMRATNAATFTLDSWGDEELTWSNLSVAVIEDPVLIVRRYMGINTMHVLHDDFLPALSTILHHPLLKEALPEKRLILAVDDFPAGNENDQLLVWLGNFWTLDFLQANIRFHSRMPPDVHLDYVCFEEVVMGADPISTSWYHYGFHSPQGPIQLPQPTRDQVSSNLQAASQWLKRGLEMPLQPAPETFTVSIVSRTKSRKILNEDDLIAGIRAEFPGCLINVLRAEESSLEELIFMAASSDVLIGVHGALLALTAFLPAGTGKSKLIELFPFAVPAENYTPFKTLAELMHVQYRSWTNPRSEAPFNIGHPEADYTAGGLGHLPASYAAGIMATETVPKHLCCYSPFWIYRIFQDTWVDIGAILELIKQ